MQPLGTAQGPFVPAFPEAKPGLLGPAFLQPLGDQLREDLRGRALPPGDLPPFPRSSAVVAYLP